MHIGQLLLLGHIHRQVIISCGPPYNHAFIGRHARVDEGEPSLLSIVQAISGCHTSFGSDDDACPSGLHFSTQRLISRENASHLPVTPNGLKEEATEGQASSSLPKLVWQPLMA